MKSLYGVAFMLLATGALAAMDVAALSRDCDSGKPAACSQLGTAYKNGAGVPKDIVQAAIFYAKGCAIGDPDTNDCYDAGLNMSLAQKARGGKKKLDEAFAQWAKSCDAGNAADCNDVGLVNQMGLGGEKDLVKARAAYAKSCEGGVVSACSNAAYAFQREPAADPAKTAGFLSKACEGKVGGDCSMLGVMYEMGDGLAKDLTRAAQYYRRACDLQYGEGCMHLGAAYYLGEGVAKDVLTAVIHWKKACDLRETRSCQMLARIYMSDRAEGKRVFEQACAQIGGCDDFRSFMGGIDTAETFKKSH